MVGEEQRRVETRAEILSPGCAAVSGGLVVDIYGYKGTEKRLLWRETLKPSDVTLAGDETWWQGLVQGKLTAALGDHAQAILPGRQQAHGHLEGYILELSEKQRSSPSREPRVFRLPFSTSGLTHVATRGLRKAGGGQDQKIDGYTYGLSLLPAEAVGGPRDAEEGQSSRGGTMRVRSRSNRFMLEEAPLASYLDRSGSLEGPSTPMVGNPPEDRVLSPVFVTEEAWSHAHDVSRRGGDCESGGIFTGYLVRDTESSMIYRVIEACLEAENAESHAAALTFTGDTWGGLTTELEQRRRRLNRPNEMILGSTHGHNFHPRAAAEDSETYSTCEVRDTCIRTTAAASAQDLEWHRAVFAGQPWAVLLVWGWNANKREDWRLYGLTNAQLSQLPVRLLKA